MAIHVQALWAFGLELFTLVTKKSFSLTAMRSITEIKDYSVSPTGKEFLIGNR